MVTDPKVRVAWSPRGNPAQMRLLKCQVFEIFFGGARGGGKTDGVLGEFGAHASRYGKDAIGLMVRRTRAELVETIERSRDIYGPLGWNLNETEKMWRAPDGARLRFAYLERDADADMYQGHNYTRVYVEEVGKTRIDLASWYATASKRRARRSNWRRPFCFPTRGVLGTSRSSAPRVLSRSTRRAAFWHLNHASASPRGCVVPKSGSAIRTSCFPPPDRKPTVATTRLFYSGSPDVNGVHPVKDP